MKILIVGLARSGTTALYFKIKQALPNTTWCLYEPPRFDPSDPGGFPDVLSKILITHTADFDYASFHDFEKRILIVRDPRDHLVSRLLYRACADAAFRNVDANVAGFIDTLRHKEAHPHSVSILCLLDRYNSLRDKSHPPNPSTSSGVPRSWAIGAYPVALEFHRTQDRLFTYKYEDFVAGNYVAIQDYLGIALPEGEATVAASYEHVGRTKSANDWKNWFTEDDVAFFRPHLAPYMRAYGYADDWTLAAEPCIRPEHGSEFVQRSVALRNRQD
jgi:hypothetical protein